MAKQGSTHRQVRARRKAKAIQGAASTVPTLVLGLLDAATIPKYVSSLSIPRVLRPAGHFRDRSGRRLDYYEIAARQFSQQILPETDIHGNTLGPTTVWGYGSAHDPSSFSFPAGTIEAHCDRPVWIKWINQLIDFADGTYLPPLLPVDQTLHWANPPGEHGPESSSTMGLVPMSNGPDRQGKSQLPYRGPVPLVTHLHGAHTTEESDGYPEAWYLPLARDIPHHYFREGSRYFEFRHKFLVEHGIAWEPGTSTYQYLNDQRATALWYHDHALGMTRTNVYCGLAGFYFLRGGESDQVRVKGSGDPAVLPGPAPRLNDRPGTRYREIPLVIQDRSFRKDGSLFYPDSREYFEGHHLQIPFYPSEKACVDPETGSTRSDVSPIQNPEFFGNTIVVNGRTWPYLEVEPGRYRFRILNGCNSRTLILKLSDDRPIWKIGGDGGFLREPVKVRWNQLVLAPAQRADVIIDFGDDAAGTELVLKNVGPDDPFQGLNSDGSLFSSDPQAPVNPADTETTGNVLQFRVIPATGPDPSTPLPQWDLPPIEPLPEHACRRQVSLSERDSATVKVPDDPDPVVLAALDCDASHNTKAFGPVMAQLGILKSDGTADPRRWMDPITENPDLGSTEIWEIHNTTADAHPIHLHQVMFEVLEREYVDIDGVEPRGPSGGKAPADPAENGPMDTVIANPGEITRIKAHFDIPGVFVWHCHILEHEDNEMMRPYVVGPLSPSASQRLSGTSQA